MQGNNNGKITGIGRVRKAATASPSPSKQPSTKAEDKEDAVVAKPSRNRSPLKRSLSAVSQEEYESGSPTPGKKKRRSKREKSQNDEYYPENNLVDSLRPGLILVMIGLNPGLTTAKTGHAYSHHTNRFWPFLHESGITPRRHIAADTHALPDLYSIGNTNICARPSRDGSTLSKEELQEGAVILEEKIGRFKPEAVCIVGKGVWEYIWLGRFTPKGKKKKDFQKEFRYGWQDEDAWLGRTEDENGEVMWKGARTFVATTTSAASTFPPRDKSLEIWKPLGKWFTERREKREEEVLGDDED